MLRRYALEVLSSLSRSMGWSPFCCNLSVPDEETNKGFAVNAHAGALRVEIVAIPTNSKNLKLHDDRRATWHDLDLTGFFGIIAMLVVVVVLFGSSNRHGAVRSAVDGLDQENGKTETFLLGHCRSSFDLGLSRCRWLLHSNLLCHHHY